MRDMWLYLFLPQDYRLHRRGANMSSPEVIGEEGGGGGLKWKNNDCLGESEYTSIIGLN